MQRPRFLSMVTSWLVTAPTSTSIAAMPLVGQGPQDVAGRAFVAGDRSPLGYLTVIARAYADAGAAVTATRGLLADAGSIQGRADIAVVGRVQESLPHPLAGGLVTWRTVAGPSGVRTAWAAAVVRRDHLVWDITVTGADTATLTGTVLDLGARLSHRTTTEWGLWDLLPDAGDLPVPMVVDAVFTGPSLTPGRLAPAA